MILCFRTVKIILFLGYVFTVFSFHLNRDKNNHNNDKKKTNIQP